MRTVAIYTVTVWSFIVFVAEIVTQDRFQILFNRGNLFKNWSIFSNT